MDGGDNFDEEWQPPTEGELKILEARRERDNKISKILGEYLLKGYKMLATTCPICCTILLRTRSLNGTTEEGVDYCVACNEMDSDVSKDDPVLDLSAARSQVLEGQVKLRGEEKDSQVPPMARNSTLSASSSTNLSDLQVGSPHASVGSTPPPSNPYPATEARPSNPEGAVSNAISMRMGRPDTGATQMESCTALGCLRKNDPPRVSSDVAGARARCAMLAICPTAKQAADPAFFRGSEQAGNQLPSEYNLVHDMFSLANCYCPLHQRCCLHHPPPPGMACQNNGSLPRNHICCPNSFEDLRMKDSLASVMEKMDWATDLLRKSTDVEESKQLCNLITGCAEAVSALKSACLPLPAKRLEERP